MDKVSRHSFSRNEKQKILEKTDCKCGHCGKVLDTDTMTVEHIFPVSKGGKDDEFNLVALCQRCNFNKGNWVYKVSEYYKYILDKYMPEYVAYNVHVASKYKKDKLINFDALTYQLVPMQYRYMIANMIKRGAKKKKILEAKNRLSMNIIMDRAYSGDAEEILELINRSRKKTGNVFNEDMYTNVYALRNDIESGEAYVLRVNKNMCGAIVFKKIKPDEIDLVQLDIIEDNTRLRKKYIMTLVCFSDIISEIIPEVMEDMYQTMIDNSTIPMYFNILGGMYNKKDDIIMMPYTLDSVNGTIEFMHLKAIKEKFSNNISDTLEFASEEPIYTEDELSDITDYLLSQTSDKEDATMEKLLSRIKDVIIPKYVGLRERNNE